MNVGSVAASVMGRRRRRVVGAALVVAGSLVIAGCSSSSTSGSGSSTSSSSESSASSTSSAGSSSSASSSANAASSGSTGGDDALQANVDKYLAPPTTITQKTPLGKAIPAGTKIIWANSGLPSTTLMVNGTKEAAAALGLGFDQVTYDSSNPGTLQSALMTALSEKPAAVIIAGNAPATYGSGTLDAYKKAGVPLVVGSVCPLTATAPLVAGMASCDFEKVAGTAFADWFITDSKGAGKAVFSNVTAIPALVAFVTAFEDEVKAKCVGCKVDVFQATITQTSDNSLVPALVNRLRSDGAYNYLFFDNGQWGDGAASALKAAGLDKKITVGGRSLDQVGLSALQQGVKGAWTASAYTVLGYGNLDIALRTILGVPNTAPVPPFQIVTAANAKDIKAPYSLPTDALTQYKKIWGVS